jgi:hypothetical protein
MRVRRFAAGLLSLGLEKGDRVALVSEGRMLNSTMKIVRDRIVAHHRRRIDGLYTAGGRAILNDQNRAAIARLE